MRNFLRAIIGFSIVLLALLVTAVSCNKVGGNAGGNTGGNNGGNNGGNGGNNGGDGGGNSLPVATGSIAINILDDDKVMLEPDAAVNAAVNAFTTTSISQPSDAVTTTATSHKTLLINSTALKAPHNGIDLTGSIVNISELNLAQTLGNLFDLTITGGAAGDATAGLLLVSTGDLASIDQFSTLAPGSIPTANSGIYVAPPNVPNSPDIYKERGFRFYGIFGDTSTPNNNNPNAAPFAFSYDKTTTSTLARQPVLACRSAIASIFSTDPTSAAKPTPDKVLTDGHKARCFLIARQNFADDAAISSWLNAASTALNDGDDTTHFKTAFSISVAGIRTDAKPLKDVLSGFPQTTDQSKVDAFMNGLDKDEMALLARNNIYAYQKILVKIVNQAKFDEAKVKANGGPPPPGTIVFENFDTSVAEMVGDTIQIKASGLPPAVGTDIAGTDIVTFAGSSAADKIKRAFDIRIKASGVAAREGLILVGPGNLLDTNNNVTNFSIDRGITEGLQNHTVDQTQRGISSQVGPAGHPFFQLGWNIFSSFMDSRPPNNAASADANASPFAFTATSGPGATKPLFFCKTALTEAAGAAAVKADTKLRGGQTASCYVGVVGADFVRQAGNDWLNTPAGNTFKKKFNIAIAGIKTDGKTIAGATGIGLPGADDDAKVANFSDGLSVTEMAALTTLNSSAHKKVAIEMVRGNLQPYVPPLLPGTTDIVFESFDTNVAEMVGDTIQIKASGLPLSVSTNIANTDIATFERAYVNKYKRAFDIRIKADSTSAQGGLLLVGPGDLLDTNNNVTNFSIDQGIDKRFRDYTPDQLKEGISGQVKNPLVPGGFVDVGWNIYASFMNAAQATSIDANASPFAFSQTVGADAVKPLFFCRTTLSAIKSTTVVQADAKLAGGQIASCYVALAGAEFSGKVGDDWLKAKENNTPNFKSKFNIAIAGIRTDSKTIAGADGIGLPGADDAAQVANFKDGISAAEMKQIADANPSVYKKVAIEMVRGTFPVYIPPLTGDSICIDKGSSYCLELTVNSAASNYVRIENNTNVVIDATELSKVISPHLSDDSRERIFQRLVDSSFSSDAVKDLFKVAYPGGKQNLVFVNRNATTTNDIVLPSYDNEMRWCSGPDDGTENYRAVQKKGFYCVINKSPYNNLDFYNHLGTVFNNTSRTTHARGMIRCKGKFSDGSARSVRDTTVSTQSEGQLCSLGVVNNAADHTVSLSLAELDNSWVDHADSVTERELYAIGIDIDGKTIPQFLPAADKFDLDKLKAGVDNETFKKILEHNNWKDLRFKVKIVKGADIPVVPNTNLVIMPSVIGKRGNFVKIVDETNVYVDAQELGWSIILKAHNGSGYHRRQLGFGDIPNDSKGELFYVDYPGWEKETAMIFVTRNHVTTNEIALDAVVGSYPSSCTGVSEGVENSRAGQTHGGVCRTAGGNGRINFDSYLGTAFDNSNDTSYARGLLMCSQGLEAFIGSVEDDTAFRRGLSRCEIGVINSGLSRSDVIDNRWVRDPDSTTEVELNVIAIKITRKSLADITSALGFTFSPGSAYTEFEKEWTNSDIKKLMSKYEWRQRKIKVKIVTSTEYDKL